ATHLASCLPAAPPPANAALRRRIPAPRTLASGSPSWADDTGTREVEYAQIVTRVVELLAGRYQLEERLARGGMGEVYRARDQLLDRTVSVKLPAGEPASGSDERFRREA